MLNLKCSVALLSLFVASPALATIHSPLVKLSEDELSLALESLRFYWSDEWVADFLPDGTLDGQQGPMAPEESGTWTVSGDTVKVRMGTVKHTWKKVRYASTGLVFVGEVFEDGESYGSAAFECQEDSEGVMRCESTGLYLQIIPGAKDKTLYKKVLKELRKSFHSLTTTAKPAKNKRTVSEVWWVGEYGKEEAIKLAKQLEGLLGPMEPKEWTWGSEYTVILVVGNKKAEAKAK